MMESRTMGRAGRGYRPWLTALAAALTTGVTAAAVSTAAVSSASAATLPADLSGGQFASNCGAATAAPIFDAAVIGASYGVNNIIAVSDPDIVLINNQWWMIFATGPSSTRAIQPFAAYLPVGASLSTSTTFPADPNGWHLVGAQANGQGQAVPVSPTPGTNGWDQLAAETPSVDVGPDGSVSIYYSGHNAGQTPFQIGLMTNFANGLATGNPNPVMTATLPWEFSSGLPALLEQSARWIPSLNKFIMYYTAGAWWASPPDNSLAYAESTDGINWVNRQKLDFPVPYYNQDFLYNEPRHRFEMVISKDPSGAGGANPRNIVWREAATTAVTQANWVNETTLLSYGGAPWYNSGLLSPSMKYGNLPGEENRLYVFFHSYTTSGDMVIGRFYCDAAPGTVPTFSLTPSAPALGVAQNTGTTMNVRVNPQANFAGEVNFSLSGLPAGVSGTLLSPSSTTGTTLVLFVTPSATPGSYPLVVTGTSGSVTQTSTFTLTVKGVPSFSLTPSVATLTLAPNTGSTMTIAVTPKNGFSGAVSFSASGFPSGVDKAFLQSSSTTGTTLVVYVPAATAPGQYPITVSGTSGSLTETTGFTLSVPGATKLEAQTISFQAIAGQHVGGKLTVSATASSGLPVSFGVVPNGNCSISGSVVTFLNTGNCGVIASQAGNSVYAPAPEVGQIIVVSGPIA